MVSGVISEIIKHDGKIIKHDGKIIRRITIFASLKGNKNENLLKKHKFYIELKILATIC